jgi:effector-binding domain-containing protein
VSVITKIFYGLLGLILLAVAVGLFLPARAHVERSIEIGVPQAAVFDVVNGFKRFNEWSPWHKYDPAATYTYSGPEKGVGARFQWKSQKPEVGSGSQEIIASEPGQSVRMRLAFSGQGNAESELRIEPAESGSRVTWSLDADFGFNLLDRYAGLLFDRFVGPDYEAGLVNLKTLLESDTSQASAPRRIEISVEDVPAAELVAVEGVTSVEPIEAIDKALADAFGQIDAFVRANKLQQAGARLVITRFYDESGWGFEAAVPVSGAADAKARARQAAGGGPIKLTAGYAGRAVKGIHFGDRADLPDTYRLLEDYVAANNLEPNGLSWEAYVSDPGTPADRRRTDVFVPVKPAP